MRALIIEHAEGEGAGHLGAALAGGGVALDVCRVWQGAPLPAALDGYRALIVLGGPMDAWDDAGHPHLAREAELLAASARAGRLTLGVCLGAQLLARGLGARVHRAAQPEVGIFPIAVNELGMADPLLNICADRHVLQWHRDTFELPAGARLLASSPRCRHQAFRVARAWGVQFHPECDAAMRADWALRGADELRAAGVDPAALTAASTAALDELGRAFGRALLDLVRVGEQVQEEPLQ
jgi:GMP synthase (glutamine-hydrolysing)